MSHSSVAADVMALKLNLDEVVLQRDLGLGDDRERRTRELLHALPAAVYTIDARGRITFFNDAAAALWGCRPNLGSDSWCGSWRLYWPDGTPLPHDECPMAIALKEERPINGMEAAAERPDGTRVPFMAFPSPLRDAAGKVVGAVNMLVDISDRHRDEQAAQRLAAIVESSDDAIVSKSLDGIIETWNKGAERLFGYTADEVIGKPITILIPADRQQEEVEILTRMRRGERMEHYETVRQRKDGSLVEISLTVSPLRDVRGTIVGVSKIARDISERKEAEERVNLLAREVDHRAKNLLALVQAMVHLTEADTADGLRRAIEGRVQALARAHALLAQSRWAGADFQHIVAEELAPYCRQRDQRARIAGPSLMLEPNVAQSLAVAVHELATNAVKYGSLSVPTGSVHVEWTRSPDQQFVFRWTETGGPAVKTPSRRGFGTNVIQRLVVGLQGEVHFDWRTEGLLCRMEVPASALAGV